MKIVKLEIEDELFAETGTFQIGMVETPAHLTEFMYFKKQDYKFAEVPQYIQDAAKKAVDYAEENGWGSCGTAVGKKRANDLATSGINHSLETLKRMYSYGSRHKADWDSSKDFETGCGYRMMAAWGFTPSNYDAAMSWLERTIASMEEMDTIDNEDYEMVEGIIELLNQVDDIENRKEMAKQVIKDFARDGVSYDYVNFLSRIGLLGMMEFQVYPELANALEEATILGCKGAHQMEGGWAPCETHEEYARLLKAKDEQMSCDYNCRTETMVDEVSISIEDLLDDGWNILEDSILTDEEAQKIMELLKELGKKEGDNFYEKFYTISSTPNAPSALDTPGRRVRFIFVPGPGRPALKSTSRKLCKQMIGTNQKVWRVEDIFTLSAQLNADADTYKLVPRPQGTTVNQFIWKNGANCNHIWRSLVFTDDEMRIPNNVRRAEEDADFTQPAAGQSGQLNPPAVHTALSYDLELPISYTEGLPIFRDLGTTEIVSKQMGCKGKFKVIDYRGETAYIPCMENDSFKAVKTNQTFAFDEEKRIITGPAVIPNKLIVRIADEYTDGMEPGERYYVYFDKETTMKMAHRFLMESRIKSANLDHSGIPLDDVYLVESWVIESEMDKAYGMGFTQEQLPIGTWMVSYRINNDDIWYNYVKKGKVLGWSVEGSFIMNDFENTEEQTYSQSDVIMRDIINILKQVN